MNATYQRYINAYLTLIALLCATVGVSFAPLEPLNLSIALVIATAKAIVVAAVFMHLRGGNRLNMLVAAGALVWLAILLVGPVIDVVFRAQV
jgi:cytochrome c oxidase subunit 4